MSKLRWQAVMMGIVILAITGFQVYWLKDNYRRESRVVAQRTQVLFRETVRELQDSLLQSKLQSVMNDTSDLKQFSGDIRVANYGSRRSGTPQTARVINMLSREIRRDSLRRVRGNKNGIFIKMRTPVSTKGGDSLPGGRVSIDSISPENIREVVVFNETPNTVRTTISGPDSPVKRVVMQPSLPSVSASGKTESDVNFELSNTIYISNDKGGSVAIRLDSLFRDTLSITRLHDEFKQVLKEEKLDLPFTIKAQADEPEEEEEIIPRMPFQTNTGFKLTLGNSFPYLVRKISLPILFSLFLVGITILSFFFLYRSLVRQQRLAILKNDLISNITHELKTPIATVGVAIEALKNFNAIRDPQKTAEYLDISQNELQRLSLLVDKVLKLSMFENKKMEMKKEWFNLEEVVKEVSASLRLQLEKFNARIVIQSEGETSLQGDRLHLLSVVFNLLDNALKYGKENNIIEVALKEEGNDIQLSVTDKGIGIPLQYREKIFEKFFRVPAGDTHNAKGHGLGLSYVAQVVQQHGGSIKCDSQEGVGTTFTIRLPKQQA